ncbi:hypothetical protein LTR66_004263 [Elasticomyces elasticus]|nr:hypothetical protein LTR66_004263 [Elasticomyces elasticus]
MLENCLLKSDQIGETLNPLAGMIFHYDPHSSDTICEAAYLATHIPVTVLVSPSNLWRMKELYPKVPGAADSIDVLPLLLKEKHLNTQRMLRLMAFSDRDDAMPLYMESIIRILKEMAVESMGASGLKYKATLQRVNEEPFAREQKGPMRLRLQLLESFMETGMKAFKRTKSAYDIFKAEPGNLTIVDLSDPFVDPTSACVLFDICIALFLEDRRAVGRILALDEAHKVG